ncbi:hypothetical protein BKA70DRAFT_1234464 [Coprinopsis sp. MPI-PUGE-AT-0042]|nr:hypothetical protein BKA70DRAFT_1234464 [Coprinopsis sp. MPI-PUGE-AT-0042]
MSLTETIEWALRDESTSSGKNAGLEHKRAILMQPEALPSVYVAVENADVCIRTRSKPKTPSKAQGSHDKGTYTLNVSLDELELPKGLAACRNDYTLASLRLGASLIDRGNSFDCVVRCIHELQAAVDRFNLSNSNVQASSILYRSIEEHYQSECPLFHQKWERSWIPCSALLQPDIRHILPAHSPLSAVTTSGIFDNSALAPQTRCILSTCLGVL